jgi:BlaI family transcriptional regulator, penicillinase repressor
MSREGLPRLAPAELDVMKVLWSSGPLSSREVNAQLAEETGWAHSTTRTLLERLVKKGFVARESFHGLHVYRPAISRAQGVARLVQDFASKVLGLSHVPVAALFQESEALTPAEVEELRGLLASPRGGRKGDRS